MQDSLIFTGQVVAPIVLLMLVGFYLRRRRIIDEDFNVTASKVIFQVALPALVFLRIAQARLADVHLGRLILVIIAALSVVYGIAYLMAWLLADDGRDRGTFVQASFSGNFAIIGLALIQNAFGETGVSLGAIILAVLLPVVNVYSIVALTVGAGSQRSIPVRAMAREILTNPLIMAALFALPFPVFSLSIPAVIVRAVDDLASLTLPLALIVIGGRLTLSTLQEGLRLASMATVNKIIVMPAIVVCLMVLLGFDGKALGVAFFLFATPTAVASCPLAEAMGCNARLAGNIVLLTTLGSVLTISTGVFALSLLELL